MKRKIIRYVLDSQIHARQIKYPLHFKAECDSLGLPDVAVYETCLECQLKSGERVRVEKHSNDSRALKVLCNTAKGKAEIEFAISEALLTVVPPCNYRVEIDDFKITRCRPSKARAFNARTVWGSRKPGDHSENV
jgi:hypothetical protein